MEAFQTCSDTSDLTVLSLPQQLHLKPEAKLSVTVALPAVRLPGKSISNWEVMERLRQIAQPDEFQVIKVSKSTLEFIRFDGEIENRSRINDVITRLDGKVVRLSGFPEPLKVRAAEANPDFPTKHDWDRYFRDAKNMNEMKPGERPDTIHIQGLPSKWFISKRDRRNGSKLPSEQALQLVFEAFGEVRCVDIPMLDPYRNCMKASISGIRTFSHTTDATFDAFIQYREYISFVKAMDSLRGMKLVQKDGVKVFSACIKVDFDKTKHLSDMSIHRRQTERERLMSKEREKEEAKKREEETLRRAMEDDEHKKQEEKRLKGERRKEREEKRKQRILKKLKKKEAEQMNIKIAIEERKLLMAQRKLESIRLLDELFERVKVERQKEITKEKENELDTQLSKVKLKQEEKLRKKEVKDHKKKEKLVDMEKRLRKKLVKKIKSAQEQQMEERRERLRKTIEGKVKMKSVLKSKDGMEIEPDPDEYQGQPFDGRNFRMPYDVYPGYGYNEWIARGGYRGRSFVPRRPFRGYRGSYLYPFPSWDSSRANSEWPSTTEQKKPKKSGADDTEEISSNSDSSATSKYSNLGSSSEDKEKKKDVKETWPGYEAVMAQDGNASHPWIGYSDYYNPRFLRRGGRRPRGPYRGTTRGGFGPAPNPNVPTNSFYMQSINEQYYRYFNKLSLGDKDGKRSRSRSRSSERVVCRKVLSRSRSRGKSYSKSRSSSRSKSGSRHSSKSRLRSHSRRRSHSKEEKRRSRSKSSNKRRSLSKDNYRKEEENIPKGSKEPLDDKKEKSTTKDKEDSIELESKAGSDLSLSLSESGDWSSPERKAKPLGNPNWEPSDNRRYRRGRDFIFDQQSSYRSRYDQRTPQIRSLVSRADRRSRSRNRDYQRDKDSSYGHKEERRTSSSHRRSVPKHSPGKKSRMPSPKRRSDVNNKRNKTEFTKEKKREPSSDDSKSRQKKDKKKKKHQEKKSRKKGSH